MLFLLAFATIAVTASSLTSCEKENIKPATATVSPGADEMNLKVNTPMKGTWSLIAVKEAGSSVYVAPGSPVTLHITNTEVVEWGPYTYTATVMTVTFPGDVEQIGYKIVGNSMTLTFESGEMWKLGKTAS